MSAVLDCALEEVVRNPLLLELEPLWGGDPVDVAAPGFRDLGGPGAAIALLPEVGVSSHCKEEDSAQRNVVIYFYSSVLILVAFYCDLAVSCFIFHPCSG